MMKKSTIDDLFKTELNELPVADQEAMWSRMEKLLDEDGGKKPGFFFRKRNTLLLLLTGAGAGVLLMTKTANTVPVQSATVLNTEKNSNAQGTNIVQRQTHLNNTNSYQQNTTTPINIFSTGNETNVVNSAADAAGSNRFSRNGNQRTAITAADMGEANASDNSDITGSENNAVVKIEVPVVVATSEPENEIASKKIIGNVVDEKTTAAQPTVTANPDKEKKKKDAAKRISLGLEAGMDIFLKGKETGAYAGIQVAIPVNKKVNLVTGLQLSKHKMQENYSNAEKQLVNPDKQIDAQLQGLTVLQMPVLYEQPLPGNKIKFRAGLTPTYIIDAGIYNIPASFTGNVANYRKFSLEDLHRLNVLFTASIGVKITRNIELDFKGNYGMTELVKNSYINQSSINNNFKSAQVGIVLRPGKKKK